MLKEKAATGHGDTLAVQWHHLTIVRFTKTYTFEDSSGIPTPVDLFAGRLAAGGDQNGEVR